LIPSHELIRIQYAGISSRIVYLKQMSDADSIPPLKEKRTKINIDLIEEFK
jgi:hypothetical protein